MKSAREVDILQHAADITAEAFQRAYAVALPGTPEYEIQAQFEFTFLRRNGHWGYPCIVGSGTNATTLHYESNRDTMKSGDLLLMDDAAEFDQYRATSGLSVPTAQRILAISENVAREIHAEFGIPYEDIDISDEPAFRQRVFDMSGRWTVPLVVIDGRPVGGYVELRELDRSGRLGELIAA